VVREKVRALIKQVKRSDGLDSLPDDGSLDLDSLDSIQLLVALEREFRLVVDDEDVTPELFHSVTSICRLVEAKTAR
jgi:acyl carrier protein